MPQLVPVSELRYNHKKVFARLGDGAVLLAQRSKAAAVLVSVEEWDRRAKRLQELEWRERARVATSQARASAEPDISFEAFMTELRTHHAHA
ncbi:MAG: type II toxin-antitoxin system Phd/YefM family antitoxin [Chloroflexota bacterium]|nr:type II toxin-antitoxin system Phd/YefM family antitoxin [Chloroflexota bacterium]